jgi:hypothetical protein
MKFEEDPTPSTLGMVSSTYMEGSCAISPEVAAAAVQEAQEKAAQEEAKRRIEFD